MRFLTGKRENSMNHSNCSFNLKTTKLVSDLISTFNHFLNQELINFVLRFLHFNWKLITSHVKKKRITLLSLQNFSIFSAKKEKKKKNLPFFPLFIHHFLLFFIFSFIYLFTWQKIILYKSTKRKKER